MNENRRDVDGSNRPSEFGLDQNRDSLAYYENGKVKEQMDLDDYEPSELEAELTYFVKSMKELYMDK